MLRYILCCHLYYEKFKRLMPTSCFKCLEVLAVELVDCYNYLFVLCTYYSKNTLNYKKTMITIYSIILKILVSLILIIFLYQPELIAGIATELIPFTSAVLNVTSTDFWRSSRQTFESL